MRASQEAMLYKNYHHLKLPFRTTVALICNEMFVQMPSEREEKIDNLLKLWKVGECGSNECGYRNERD